MSTYYLPRRLMDQTGQEISQADEDLIYASLAGSAEKGRQLREEYLRMAERGEIAVIGVSICLELQVVC
jgi:hypothetical protein